MLRICQKGDQIKTLTEHRWDVAPQNEEGVWYRVSFAGESPTCECAYHTTGKGCRCKHIAAVEHELPILSEAVRYNCSNSSGKATCSPGSGERAGAPPEGRPTPRANRFQTKRQRTAGPAENR